MTLLALSQRRSRLSSSRNGIAFTNRNSFLVAAGLCLVVLGMLGGGYFLFRSPWESEGELLVRETDIRPSLLRNRKRSGGDGEDSVLRNEGEEGNSALEGRVDSGSAWKLSNLKGGRNGDRGRREGKRIGLGGDIAESEESSSVVGDGGAAGASGVLSKISAEEEVCRIATERTHRVSIFVEMTHCCL